jgi:hypothetical protein
MLGRYTTGPVIRARSSLPYGYMCVNTRRLYIAQDQLV